MTIFLMRHGLAERAAPGQDDSTRELTEQGRADVFALAKALAVAEPQLEYLFTSPFKRAKQTAEVVGSALEMHVQEDKRLAPGCALESVEDLYAEHGAPERFMTVGHQPDVGYLVQALTGSSVSVREGTIVVIDAPALKAKCGTLVGVFAPGSNGDLIRVLQNRR